MHLRSITMKGFKSFPDRTRLEFAPGVSVIVGPNGSGKSNVTDAVLWALGEQSPLAVRGQTMQDVIFSGARGVPSRSAAEVEVVIDDSDFELGGEFSELSITRRLDRSGEGEYRMNGARCRLVDVLEALSDTGLGKEMHSVVSQGRVEAVIHSSARDRRLLIEEAAGLGKHRKRRRRAELKLGRTEDNLARALDVEREARSRLRPLKRQAEAADLHARLERQSLEARLALARDEARSAREALGAAEGEARAARSRRDAAERRLDAVRARREAAERAVEERASAREALAGRLFGATGAADRVEMRLERVRAVVADATADGRRARAELERLEEVDSVRAAPSTLTHDRSGSGKEPTAARVAGLERDLAALDAEAAGRAGADRLIPELERLRKERQEADRRRNAAHQRLIEARRGEEEAGARLLSMQARRRESSVAVERARSEAARTAAELEAVEQLARTAAPAPGDAGALARHVGAEPGFELALAAALGHRLRAGLASDLGEGAALLDSAPPGSAVVLSGGAGPVRPGPPPVPGAERLLDRVAPASAARAAAERLLADAWVVESLEALPDGFTGIAVTRSGRALDAAAGEVRQAATGADDALLERLSQRDELAGAAAVAARSAADAEEAAAGAGRAQTAAEEACERAAERVRAARHELEAAEDAARAAERAILRREADADEGLAVRRAELTAELRAERRAAERAERERELRQLRARRLRARLDGLDALRAAADGAVPAVEAAVQALGNHRESLRADLTRLEAAGSATGEELRNCAREEAEVQRELRDAGDLVTGAEVQAQRARDAVAEVEHQLGEIRERLAGPPEELAAESSERPLSDDERAELRRRVERLTQRREQLGPVNPLAKDEYDEAVARVEELERQRGDLERALAELETIVRETDRQIAERFEETFEATARNFEEVVEELFPGGRGRLRLASPRQPSPVLGDEQLPEEHRPHAEGTGSPAGAGSSGDLPATAANAEGPEQPDPAEPGVEVEVTPAGKSTRRLSLLSGGERALVALAFLFAVFLARPCPFYVLDEVEAALDDLNIDRFLRLVRRCATRAQFIVVTHQKRTMDAADRLYGVSMGDDGISKVVSRRLPASPEGAGLTGEGGRAAA